MTEAEWLASDNPEAMLDFLGDQASPRKFRLFAVACCRRAWDRFLDDDLSRKAVEVAERYADGAATDEEALEIAEQLYYGAPGHCQAACHAINSSFDYGYCPAEIGVKYPYNSMPAICCASDAAGEYMLAGVPAASDEEIIAEAILQCQLVRDVFGNPFRRLPIDPLWMTPTVLSIAEAVYEDRVLPSGELRTDHLAILADALEDGGCTNADLSGHLRGPGPHVRGCFVVDLILSLT